MRYSTIYIDITVIIVIIKDGRNMRRDILVAYTYSCCLECLGNKINHMG